MSHLRRQVATANSGLARVARVVVRGIRDFEIPAPRLLIRPIAAVFVLLRDCWWWVKRVFICQPFFRSACYQCGKHLRTDIYLHWINGDGRIIAGDRVTVDGKCGFTFSARYVDHPTLEIGDHSRIGSGCSFVIAERITIGRHTLLAQDIRVMDASGHPLDPDKRRQGLPTPADKIKPVLIGDNVWIGARAIILPGTHIGNDAVIQAGALVSGVVPPGVLYGGNPGRVLKSLRPERLFTRAR